MKKPFLLLLISLLFLVSCAATYYFYQEATKTEITLQEAQAVLKQKEIELAIVASLAAYLLEEYTNLYEAYSQCCEPKTPL